jgi:hypothetical protein
VGSMPQTAPADTARLSAISLYSPPAPCTLTLTQSPAPSTLTLLYVRLHICFIDARRAADVSDDGQAHAAGMFGRVQSFAGDVEKPHGTAASLPITVIPTAACGVLGRCSLVSDAGRCADVPVYVRFCLPAVASGRDYEGEEESQGNAQLTPSSQEGESLDHSVVVLDAAHVPSELWQDGCACV